MRLSNITSIIGNHIEFYGFWKAGPTPVERPNNKSIGEWNNGYVQFRLLWDAKEKLVVLQHRGETLQSWSNLEVATKKGSPDNKLLASLNPVLHELFPDSPAFPLTVRWTDGETDTYDSIFEVVTGLQVFESDYPEVKEVMDALGRPVDLSVDIASGYTLRLLNYP